MTNLDLFRGRESKESAGAADGSLYRGFWYAMVFDWWAGRWGICVHDEGLTVEETDVDAGRAYLCSECAIQDRVCACRVVQVARGGRVNVM